MAHGLGNCTAQHHPNRNFEVATSAHSNPDEVILFSVIAEPRAIMETPRSQCRGDSAVAEFVTSLRPSHSNVEERQARIAKPSKIRHIALCRNSCTERN